jgi:hypothetical protein
MNTRWLHILGLLLLIPQLQADPVTLTDTQGRSIEAEILRAIAGNVTVKMANGHQFRIPMSKFNEESHKTIERWKLAQVATQREPFRISMRTFKENEVESGSRSTKLKTYDQGFEVTVRNMSLIDLPAMKVEYVLLKLDEGQLGQDKDSDTYEVHKGSIDLAAMKMSDEITFKTMTLSIQENTLRGGWYYANRGQRKAKDDLDGIWMKFKVGDQIIYEYAKPSSLPEDVDWDKQSASF